jgi:hypothetical protein
MSETASLKPTTHVTVCDKHKMLTSVWTPFPLYLQLNKSLATVYMQLQLQAGIKNHFQQLEVHIPFPGLQVSIMKPSPSVGSVSIQSGSTLVWNVGSKFPARLLDATLNAVCKLRRKTGCSSEQQVDEDMNGWEQYINSCALVTNKNNTFIHTNPHEDTFEA